MATRQPMSPDDVTLQAGVASVLARFPALRAVVPTSLPTDSRYKITVDKMLEYSDDRTKAYWHQINLPLALHAYGYSPEPFLHELLGSMLKTLNDFCARLDVEAFHKPDFGSKTDAEIRAALEARAHNKAVAKFRDLPPGEVGIVAEVAVVSIEDVGRRFERTPMRAPRPLPGLANRFWMPLRLVGVRAPDLRFVLDDL